MIRAPEFWQRDGWIPALLSPLSGAVAAATARRVERPGFRAAVPVICCGNAGVGGAGKTPLALDLGRRLLRRNWRIAFLTRGHGGRFRGVAAVDPDRDEAERVGDEALLLARLAPTFVAADRAAGAVAALAAGAQILIMDDGLQNPSLQRDLSVLVVDGGAGFGNGRVMPAGPLREPVAAATARCQAAVLIGKDTRGVAARLAPLPVLRATMATAAPPGRLLAFAGIGRPEKFFASLREAGAELVETRGFADHHRYRDQEVDALLRRAARLGAALVTTEKDAVRLPRPQRSCVQVAPVRLIWADPADPECLLDRCV